MLREPFEQFIEEPRPTLPFVRRHHNTASATVLTVGMYKQPLAQCAAQLIIEGKSIRAVVALTGMAKLTVAKLRLRIKAAGLLSDCPCGKPNGHRGWCSYRFERSTSRQAVVARFTRVRTI